MRAFTRIRQWQQILSVLEDFSPVFPHLAEKIDSMETFAQKLAQHAYFCVGQEDDQVFGLVVFYANDQQTATAYISLIGVQPSVRKQGMGQWLLTQCMQEARTQGMGQIRLEVDLDNPTAIAFYRKNGFTESGHTDRNSMYMSRALADSESLV